MILTYHVLLLRCEFVEASSSTPDVYVTGPQALANICEEPFVWNFESVIVRSLGGFPPEGPPGLFDPVIDNVALGGDGDA